MNIGLIDVDGHNFPNFALMRASAYHKAKGDQVEWATPFNRYDKVLASKVFTFTPPKERKHGILAREQQLLFQLNALPSSSLVNNLKLE